MIKKETLAFLEELSVNNNREWFQDKKADYDAAREDILQFTTEIIKGLSKVDSTIPAELEAKNCVMRIYRDIRFSKDKTPYKTNFGIAISARGKNFDGAGYYMHIQPGKSFVAGGHWMPSQEHLKAIRQEIDYNSSEFRDILETGSFKKQFEKLSEEDKLKTTPKGYPSDHADADYLKLKSFIASSNVSDKELFKPGSPERIVDMFGSLYPLMVFLRNAIA